MDTLIFILLIIILGSLCYLLSKSLNKAKAKSISTQLKLIFYKMKAELEGNTSALNSKD